MKLPCPKLAAAGHAAVIMLASPLLGPATIAAATDVAAPQDPAAIRNQIAAAEAQAKAAQEQLAALQARLKAAEQAAFGAKADAAGRGDQAALAALVDGLAGEESFVDAAVAAAARSPPERTLQLVRPRLAAASPVHRSKLCWLLGQIGGETAAALLAEVVERDADANVVGNAIHALSRCPDSPASRAAVARHIGDRRKLTHDIGHYSAGTFGDHPLGLLAAEYVDSRDASAFATVPGELIVEEPTLFCAGFQWRIGGDSNRNCTVSVAYRGSGETAWRTGYPFLRCRSWESTRTRYTFQVGNLLAGSLFDLQPGTSYEVKLTLKDPDGGAAERTVTVTTRTEPPHYPGLRTRYVMPADPAAAGAGTRDDPFRGIAAADQAAQPGDVFVLLAGTYTGGVALRKSGEPGKPIVWRGEDRAKVILDGSGQDESLSFTGQDWLQFEDLTFRGARQGCIKTYGCHHIVVRRCVFRDFSYGGIVAQGRPEKEGRGRITPARNCRNWFITDNEIYGRKPWTRGRGDSSSYNINISGAGHVIAWNRSQDCWDAISLAGGRGQPDSGSLDICYNDLRQAVDDGVEADYIFHNTRIYRNRLFNTFSTLSNQPVYGGPGYMLYNAMYNTSNKPYKLHVDTTGMIIAHNTSISGREAWYGGSSHDVHVRNNLILGVPGESGYWLSIQAFPFDMDYVGYSTTPTAAIIKLNNVRYRTMAEFAAGTGTMQHSVEVGLGDFVRAPPPPGHGRVVDPAEVDLRLAAGSKAVDAGIALPGINDGFTGRAPDLGCYESGQPIPHYGPRHPAPR